MSQRSTHTPRSRPGIPKGSGRLPLAVILLTAGAMAGCLASQEIDLDVPPEEVNVPPTFDPTKDVAPRDAVVCVSGLDETATEFRLNNLRDGNGHRLEARWFIDYAGGFTAIQKTQLLERQADEPVYPPATLLSSEIDPFHRTLGQPYFVEVVVSDGFAGADASPKNRAAAEGSYAVSVRWAVDYKAGTPCP